MARSKCLTCLFFIVGGARVIQIGGGTRDLYYYPKDTVLVTAISPKLKKGMQPASSIQGVLLAQLCMHLSLHRDISLLKAFFCNLAACTVHAQPKVSSTDDEEQAICFLLCPSLFAKEKYNFCCVRLPNILLSGCETQLDQRSESVTNQLCGIFLCLHSAKRSSQRALWDMILTSDLLLVHLATPVAQALHVR